MRRALRAAIAVVGLMAVTAGTAQAATPTQIERHWFYGQDEYEFRQLPDGTWQGVTVSAFSWDPACIRPPGTVFFTGSYSNGRLYGEHVLLDPSTCVPNGFTRHVRFRVDERKTSRAKYDIRRGASGGGVGGHWKYLVVRRDAHKPQTRRLVSVPRRGSAEPVGVF